MSTKREFLHAVLPPEQVGLRYCSVFIGKSDISGPVNNRVIQRFHTSIEELIGSTESPPAGVWNTYYLVAVTRAENRKKESIQQHKAFFLDFDLKSYPTKTEIATAIRQFYETFELPRPSIVDSGNGLHAYWILEETVTTYEWLKVAEHLKQLCVEHKIFADPTVTADPARIMRVPDTMNVKDVTDPKECTVPYIGTPISLESFKIAIGYSEGDSFDTLEARFMGVDPMMDSATQNLLGQGLHKELVQGLKLSLNGYGCEYLRMAYLHQEHMSEPQWRSALSIAQHCSDSAKGIHFISNKHPNYNKTDTITKAASIPAPHTCEMFRTAFSQLPPPLPQPTEGKSFCDSCRHKKDIKSPIMLCVTQELATAEDSTITTVDADTGATIEVQVPIHTYPQPYYGLKGGGVFKRVRVDDLEASGDEDVSLQYLQGKKIYDYHIWVDSLQVDPVDGEVIVVCLKQPRQDLVRFSIPFNQITALSVFTEVMSTYGVSAPNYKELMDYFKAFVVKLQNEFTKTVCPASFGWDENYSSFVLGSRRYLSTGEVEFCLPSSAMQDASVLYGMRNLRDVPGATDDIKRQTMLASFKEIIKLYSRPGNEARLFTVFVSMGSPLFAFFDNIDGMVLHLTNKESGVGKSTVQHVANAVWGIPNNQTLMSLSDTKLAILQRLGVLRHVAMCIDELTTVEADKLCQFIFDISQGRGRHRMEANTNRMRQNVTSWRVPVITSGNNGLHQLMTKHKMVADGEAMRTLELEITRDLTLSNAEGKAITDRLFSTDIMMGYGIAGDILLRYYVPHADECRAKLMKVREQFDRDASLTQRERFYSALCAIALVAAEISKDLGFHDIDMEAFYQWTIEMCKHSAAAAATARIPLVEQFKEFLHEMSPNTLITTQVDSKIAIMQAPATNQITYVRIMKDKDLIYIMQTKLRSWCTDRSIPYNDVLEMIEKHCQGARDKRCNFDLSNPVAVRCIRMPASLVYSES